MPTVPQTNRDQVTSKDRAPVGDGSVLGPTPDGGGPVNPGAHDLSELSGADDVQAIEALTGTGLLARTTTNAWALRSLTAPAAGLTISNPAGIAGNPSIALADDLAALEALSGAGWAKRTGTSAWSLLSSIPAEDVSYDPSTSGLTATDVQAALDELAAMTGADAADITFDPSATDLLSTNVQDAIGELDLIVQGKADISSLAAVALSGAATDVVVSSPNLSSTDVGSALDELFGLIGGNPFDQDLNTTDSPSFDGLSLSSTLNSLLGANFGTANGTAAVINGGAGVTGQKYFYNLNVNGDNQFGVFPDGTGFIGNNFNKALQFYTNGANRLNVAGNGLIAFTAYGAGTLTTDSSGNITATSDERLKTGIKPFTRGLNELLKIKPIAYKWSEASGLDTAYTYYGFSAQNVQTAIPEAVGRMNNTGTRYLTFQERPILAAVVNALKSINERISNLEAIPNNKKAV